MGAALRRRHPGPHHRRHSAPAHGTGHDARPHRPQDAHQRPALVSKLHRLPRRGRGNDQRRRRAQRQDGEARDLLQPGRHRDQPASAWPQHRGHHLHRRHHPRRQTHQVTPKKA